MHEANPERTVLLSNTAHWHNTATAPHPGSQPKDTSVCLSLIISKSNSSKMSLNPKDFPGDIPQTLCNQAVRSAKDIINTAVLVYLDPTITENSKTHSWFDT